jgi:LPS-assembly protein
MPSCFLSKFITFVVTMLIVLAMAPHSAKAQYLTGYQNAVKTEIPQASPQTKTPAPPSDQPPVDLQADDLQYDETSRVVTANGNVMLVQSGRILRADSMTYNVGNDEVTAAGNVVLNEENGDIHTAEAFTLTDGLKDGFIEGLKSYLADGSRFTAKDGKREDASVITMYDATYTPCEPCKLKPEKAPVWQIRASEVKHDEIEKSISYKNPRLEAYGVPVMYVPYFSHPDGSIKRKSGLLAPSAGFKSDLGAYVTNRYYWDIAPDKDATFGLMAMTEEAPLGLMEWRQRWQQAALKLSGGVTYSERTDSEAGQTVQQDQELRGHVLGSGRWDMNDKWRSGVNIAWTSDDQYMRQYDFTNEDVLENEIYAERFSGRNYAAGRLLTFQDIRVRENREDQPQVLPEIIASFKGEPGEFPLIKGNWEAETSLLGLRRDGSGQDMNRLSLQGGWKRRLISDYGLLTDMHATARTDFYSTRESDADQQSFGDDEDETASRFFPQMHIQSSYPLERPFEHMQARVEPIVALTMAPNIDVTDDIPNEDSQDVQIDASNLFEPNRFPGADRVEDRSRVTYGIRTGLYGYDGSQGDVFLGQSYALAEDDNPFPEGSGLDRQESDFVGQISGRYKDMYSLDYRFQLASANLSSQRHEVDAAANWHRFQINSRYLFAKALENTDIDESREQIDASAAYFLANRWRTRLSATHDLGEDSGLRQAGAGLDYLGQCLSWSLTGSRNYTDDSSGESDTEFLFTVGLKNLGGFMEGALEDLPETQ